MRIVSVPSLTTGRPVAVIESRYRSLPSPVAVQLINLVIVCPELIVKVGGRASGHVMPVPAVLQVSCARVTDPE